MSLAHEGTSGACPCCLESDWKQVYKDIVACRKCGHQIYDRAVDPEDLAQIYRREFSKVPNIGIIPEIRPSFKLISKCAWTRS